MTIQTPSTENLFIEEKRLSGIIIICLIFITFFRSVYFRCDRILMTLLNLGIRLLSRSFCLSPRNIIQYCNLRNMYD
jgi:hypothetical protein